MHPDSQHQADWLTRYHQLDTPFLSIDKTIFLNNLAMLKNKIEQLGSTLRPHFKTIRALEAAKFVLSDHSAPVTVSTLKEAEALASMGYNNFLYAVGIAQAKFPRVKALIEQGAKVDIILDSVDQAVALNNYCSEQQCVISALIELDCDGHRGGIKANDPELIEIAQILQQGAAEFLGVLTHAGESYLCFDDSSLKQAAANEVNQVLLAKQQLTGAGIPCSVTSIGSTPTACRYQDLTGISEVRAGVYSFFDLVMAGIGVCQHDDIALSVVTTVIGHNREKGWLFIDAGWMALSSDRGTANQPVDCGYGLITNQAGEVIPSLLVDTVNQEHGIIKHRDGENIDFSQFPIGSRLHILPNHACATTAMHDNYQVIDKESQTHETWARIKGW
ncbi:alanine racemase [Vibrio sp. MACH09]|uniref:DSD1 family PLP-dependent enzyme n=1 Tax=Vibrio sp. MACH09 TaxID=3025122 RepID=UPI00278E5F74|nr:DSD1 family PLP-dependent enzyme [Vibrio sp. MACH09]GLO62679.1 alanine racemase [Vibrio sp. MACH09]